MGAHIFVLLSGANVTDARAERCHVETPSRTSARRPAGRGRVVPGEQPCSGTDSAERPEQAAV